MNERPTDRTDYLSLVSAATTQLARLGFVWQPGTRGGDGQSREAKVLAFTPVANRNGFQSLLYQAAWSWGIAPIPVLDSFSLPKIPWPGRMVCHFHWLGGITAPSSDVKEAEARVEQFAHLLHTLKQQGRQIVWTVHNVLPHDAKWPEQDLKIREIIAREADSIHIMTGQTETMVEGYYELPRSKTFLVPHPAYNGFYPDSITRNEARARLAVPQDSHVFLTFGAIQRYKGYERLITAFENLVRRRPRRKVFLIIAGNSSDNALTREIRAWALSRDDVAAVIKPIANEHVQLFYRAADVAICPYNATLNSGAALLAITFGKPVIGPRLGGFVDNVGPACAWLYDPSDGTVESLLGAMKDSLASGPLQSKSAASSERARALTGEAASHKFFSQLDSVGANSSKRPDELPQQAWQRIAHM